MPAATPWIIPFMKRVVVFRHGLLLNRYSMLLLERFLRQRGFEVHNKTYPPTRKYIEEHGEDLFHLLTDLARRLDAAGEPYELYAVTHSMGGLVLRYALTHFEAPPVRRAVMLVPPNRGSATARFFRNFPPYRWLFGSRAARQLAAETPVIFEEAGVPQSTEIGILAGSVRWKLYPTKLEKPHDSIVSVSETRLGSFPVKVLPYAHSPILFARRTREETAHFLEHGTFLPDG